MIVFFSMFFLSSAKLFFFRVIVTRLNRFRSRNYSDNSGGDGGGVNDNDGGNDDTVYRGSGADAQLIILISSITTPPAI